MPSRDKTRNDASSDSGRPTMDTANRQQEIKTGNANVTAEGETSRSVNERSDVERDSGGRMENRRSNPRGIVET